MKKIVVVIFIPKMEYIQVHQFFQIEVRYNFLDNKQWYKALEAFSAEIPPDKRAKTKGNLLEHEYFHKIHKKYFISLDLVLIKQFNLF